MLSEAMSPITHMSGVSGNESILNREKVVFKNDVVEVPVLSGNALRHRMIRGPGALYLVDACGLRGNLNIDQANYMFTGGSLTESSTTDNIPAIAKLHTVSPLYRLLGGALKNQVVGGSLFVSRGILVCEENKGVLEKTAPSIFGIVDEKLMPAQSFISKYQYTRGDAARMKDASEIVKGDAAPKSNLMVYNGETVIQGAIFYHDVILYNVSPLEVGAALHAIHLWQNGGGTIGGSARIGHGKLNTSLHIEGLEDWFGALKDPCELIKDYIAHVNTHVDELSEWLRENF
jgi:hypothetical protein